MNVNRKKFIRRENRNRKTDIKINEKPKERFLILRKKEWIPPIIVNQNRSGFLNNKNRISNQPVYLSASISKIQQIQSELDITKIPEEFEISNIKNEKQYHECLLFYGKRINTLYDNYKSIRELKTDIVYPDEFLKRYGIVNINKKLNKECKFQALNLHKRLIRETFNWFGRVTYKNKHIDILSLTPKHIKEMQ